MRHKTFMLVLIAMLLSTLLPTVSFADTAVPKHLDSLYVNDFANVITEKNENYMVNYGIRLHQQTGTQVVLVTVNSTNGIAIGEYANSLFKAWEVGSADQGNGVLLLLSIKDNQYSAVWGSGVKNRLTEENVSKLLAGGLEPDLAKKDYNSGARNVYGALIQSLGGIWKEWVGSKIYVSDNAGVFKQVTRNYLNQAGNRFAKTTGGGIYVVTVKNPGELSLQEYIYAKFASMGAGSKDVMLVFDIEGDNYHVLQGKEIDTVLTNEWIGGILDKVLEPLFVHKNYASGAVATASAFYGFMLARAEIVQPAAELAPNTTVAAAQPVVSGDTETLTDISGIARTSENRAAATQQQQGVHLPVLIITGLLLGFILFIGLAAAQRKRVRPDTRSAVPIDPYGQHKRNIRRSGSWIGQPRFAYGSRWHNRLHRHHRHYREPGPESPSGSSSRETHPRGGGSSNEEGSGRYS